MSFVSTQPEALTAAAGTLQGIGSSMSAQNAAAAAATRGFDFVCNQLKIEGFSKWK